MATFIATSVGISVELAVKEGVKKVSACCKRRRDSTHSSNTGEVIGNATQAVADDRSVVSGVSI